MPFALKLQATVGEITAFDCTGGEPADQHRTILEQDPADPDVVDVLGMTFAQVADALGPDVVVADWINANLLGKLVPSDSIDALIDGELRVQIRKMDSDNRS